MIALLSTSCSLKNSSQTALHIEIPRTSALSRSSLQARSASTAGNYQTAPTSLADFDCYAVNVSGEDILPANPKQCSLASDTIGVPGGWVSAQPSSDAGNAAIDLMVPGGPHRLIQIYGVRTPDACPKLGDFSSTRLGDIYLLGNVTTDIFNDMSVSIKASLDPSKKAFSSCKGGAVTTLATVTYYVLGPTAANVSLPVPNGAQYSLTSVSATSQGTTTATDDGSHTQFSYNPSLSVETDSFTYTAADSTGALATGKIIIKNVTPFTWTGEAGDSLWSTAGNWCGTVNAAHSACSGGTAPATLDKAIFDGTCVGVNCNATINTSAAINALRLSHDYTGTLTQSLGSTSFNVTSLLELKGGNLRLNNLNSSFSAPGMVNVDGGSLIAGSGQISNLGTSSGVFINSGLLDLSASSNVSLGTLTLNGGTFNAPDGGLVTFNGTITSYAGTFNPGVNPFSTKASILNNTGAAQAITASSPLSFQNLSIFTTSASTPFTLSGTLIVQGNLTLSGMSGQSASTMNGGLISVIGDLNVDSGFGGYTGTTQVTLNSPSTQTITDYGSANYPQIFVSKSGTLNINNASSLVLHSLSASAVNHTGQGALILPSGNISPGTLTQVSTGDMLFPGGTIYGDLHVQAAGKVTLSGATNVTGTLTIDAGASLNKMSFGLTQGTLINNGTIIP